MSVRQTPRAIITQHSALPRSMEGWFTLYHPNRVYEENPYGERSHYLTRLLTYYLVYAKIFAPRSDSDSYNPIATRLDREISNQAFRNYLETSGVICGSVEEKRSPVTFRMERDPFVWYRNRRANPHAIGFWREAGSVLVEGAGEVYDHTIGVAIEEIEDFLDEIKDFLDNPEKYLHNNMEKWLLDGTLAQSAGWVLGAAGCPPCPVFMNKIAATQSELHKRDYMGLTAEKTTGRGKSKYEYFCWMLDNYIQGSPIRKSNFRYGLFQGNEFENKELGFQTNLASLLAPHFKQNVTSDPNTQTQSVLTDISLKKSLEAPKDVGFLEILRLFHAIRLLPRFAALRNRSDDLKVENTKTKIPFVILPQSKVPIELPQMEALLLLLAQYPSIMVDFALFTQDPYYSTFLTNSVIDPTLRNDYTSRRRQFNTLLPQYHIQGRQTPQRIKDIATTASFRQNISDTIRKGSINFDALMEDRRQMTFEKGLVFAGGGGVLLSSLYYAYRHLWK